MQIVKNPQVDADVRMLLGVFSDLLPDGREVQHEQIETVLKLARTSSRYRTVTKKWRRIVFEERGVYLNGRGVAGRGFVALLPNEMVRFGNREVRGAGRRFQKAIAIMALPADEQLSADVKRQRQLLLAATERIAREHKHELRAVTRALAPMKQLPRATA